MKVDTMPSPAKIDFELMSSERHSARLGDEGGDRAILHQQQAVAFGHDDLRAVGDDVGRAAGVGTAPGVGALRHRGEQRRRRRQALRHRVEILPLVAQHATDRTHHRLYKTHDIAP
jgi:hypothetical protein